MKPVEIHRHSSQAQCLPCKTAVRLVRHNDLIRAPKIYVFYRVNCQRVETILSGYSPQARWINPKMAWAARSS